MKWFFILSGMVYFLQGIEGLPGLAVSLWLKETMMLKDFELQRMMSYVTLAWLVKPLWGYLVDTYLSKKTWISMSLVMGVCLCAALAMLSFVGSIWMLIAIMAALNWTMAVRDVANDGIACVEGKRTGTTGKFQSIQWGSLTFAGLLATLGGGYVASHYTFQHGYLMMLPLLMGAAIFLRFVPSSTVECVKSIRFSDYRRLLKRDFLLVCLFILVFNTAPSFGAPLFYKQRDVFHWTPMTIAYLGVFGAVLNLIGSWVYFKFHKILPMRKVILGSIMVFAPTTLLYLHYTPITAWIYTGIFGVIGMVVFLVCMDFMARKAITGLEATSFATLCSVSNLASWLSLQLGSYSLEWFGLTTTIFINAGFGLLALPLVWSIKWEEK